MCIRDRKEYKQHEYHLHTERRLSYPKHHYPQDQAPRTLDVYKRQPEGIAAQVQALATRGLLTAREAQAVDTASLLSLIHI